MSMNVGGSGSDSDDPDVMMDINTTPLIDVMLVLLIMLIITIPLQTHAIKLDLPVGTPPPADNPPPIVNIDVDFDGTTTWNGDVIQSRDDLDARLRGVAAANPQPEIHLNPNKLVVWRHVSRVMADAQRLHVTKIGLIGNEQFLDQ